MRRILPVAIILAIVALIVVWKGFRAPSPLPDPDSAASRRVRKTVLYDGLPAPLQYYLTQTVSRTPPVTTTAVVWGTGHIAVGMGPIRLRLPVSWQEAIDVERGFV